MNIFGLTPVDTALASWGLNAAQDIIEFLFNTTRFGLAAFAIGFLWSTWQCAREGHFKHLAIFFFICLLGMLVFVKRSEPQIKSIQETFNTSITSAQSLKNLQTKSHDIPLMLSFVSQLMDSVCFGSISIIDNALAGSMQFLHEPFVLQKSALQISFFLNNPKTSLFVSTFELACVQ